VCAEEENEDVAGGFIGHALYYSPILLIDVLFVCVHPRNSRD